MGRAVVFDMFGVPAHAEQAERPVSCQKGARGEEAVGEAASADTCFAVCWR